MRLQEQRTNADMYFGPRPEYDEMQAIRMVELQKRLGACDALETIMEFIRSPDFTRLTRDGKRRISRVAEQLTIFRDDA